MKLKKKTLKRIFFAIRLIVLLALIAFTIYAVLTGMSSSLISALAFVTVVWLVHFVMTYGAAIQRALSSARRAIADKLALRTGTGFIYKALDFILKPLETSLRKRMELRKKYIKAKSERQFFVTRGRRARKGREHVASRIRASVASCRENGEKVRMLYVIKILKMKEAGLNVKASNTPGEAYRLLPPGCKPTLFSTYERVRYDENYPVTDDVEAECERN